MYLKKKVKTGISKNTKYIDPNNLCVYRCNTCDICQEYITNYYENVALLRDDDENLHIPKVIS